MRILILLLFSITVSAQTAVKELILTGPVLDTTVTSNKVNRGWIRYNPVNGKYRFWNSVTSSWFSFPTVAGSGTIVGSTGSVDNAMLRADGTGGITLQSSPLVISDNADIDLGISASTSGSLRTIQARGTAADISLFLQSKGAGDISVTSNTGSVFFSGNVKNEFQSPILSILNVGGSSTASEVRLNEGPTIGSNYIGLKSPNSVTSNVTYTLPEAPSVSGQVLSSTTVGAMSWITQSVGDMVLSTAQTSTGKKTFQGDATNSGIRISGSLEPSTKVAGDLWLETSIRGYINGANVTFMTMNSTGITNTRIPFGTGNAWLMSDASEFTWTNTGNKSLNITGTANIGLGVSSFGASADNVFGIGNGTPPSTSPVDMVQLYAEDVAASSELKVRDEAGNVTTLSPHNFSIIGFPSEIGAWSHYSEYTNENGEREAVNVDMLKLARLLEKLTGEKLVYKTKLK